MAALSCSSKLHYDCTGQWSFVSVNWGSMPLGNSRCRHPPTWDNTRLHQNSKNSVETAQIVSKWHRNLNLTKINYSFLPYAFFLSLFFRYNSIFAFSRTFVNLTLLVVIWFLLLNSHLCMTCELDLVSCFLLKGDFIFEMSKVSALCIQWYIYASVVERNNKQVLLSWYF